MAAISITSRSLQIDSLRGLAVMGILWINILGFAFPPYFQFQDLANSSIWDRWLLSLINLFVVGKFLSIFAIIFGYGLALQLHLAEDPLIVRKKYFRRMMVLLILGIGHLLLFWYGDILHIYALLGILIYFFRRFPSRQILIIALIVWAIPVELSLMELFASRVEQSMNSGLPLHDQGDQKIYLELTAQTIKIFSQGNLQEICKQRLAQIQFQYSHLVFSLFHIGGLILLGFYFGSTERVVHFISSTNSINKVMRNSLLLAIPTNLLFVMGQQYYSPMVTDETSFIMVISFLLGSLSAALFYTTILFWLFKVGYCKKILYYLAQVGRLSLSNYLLQTLILTTICNSYGGALYGQLTISQCLILALSINLLEIFGSVWWLNRFYFGPLEWIWRVITYGKYIGLVRLGRDKIIINSID